MSSLLSNSQVSMQSQSSSPDNNTWRGFLTGIIPLILLVIIVVIALAGTALVRQLFAPAGFFAQQQAAVITLVVGLVIALVVYVGTIVRALRRVAARSDKAVSRCTLVTGDHRLDCGFAGFAGASAPPASCSLSVFQGGPVSSSAFPKYDRNLNTGAGSLRDNGRWVTRESNCCSTWTTLAPTFLFPTPQKE
jgi:uncharacterized membrane protein